MIVRLASVAASTVGAPFHRIVLLAATTATTAASSGSGLGSIPLNQSGLPGSSTLIGFMGGLRWIVLALALVGLLVSALMWALSAHSANNRYAGSGRTGVLVALGVALLAGAGPYLINFFFSAGGAVS